MNKIMLIGNVGKDPDVRYYDAVLSVANFSLDSRVGFYCIEYGRYVCYS